MTVSTKHAHQRAHERLGLNKSERSKLFNKVISQGLPPEQFIGEFREFLQRKKTYNHKVKVFEDNIYIYKGHTIITVMHVPDRFKPVSNFRSLSTKSLIDNFKKIAGTDAVKFEVILFRDETYYVGLTVNDAFENYGIGPDAKEATKDAIEVYKRKHAKEIKK